MAVQEGYPTSRTEIGSVLRNLVRKMDELMNKNRLGGHRTDLLAKILKRLSSAIAKKTKGRFDSNAKNQTMGAAESPIGIMPDARNAGIRLKRK